MRLLDRNLCHREQYLFTNNGGQAGLALWQYMTAMKPLTSGESVTGGRDGILQARVWCFVNP